ncbi:MAG: DUF4474 domain-containing protein [Clostridia bacterium]|nr:DUF4474 domain-containing protein [Clostridia bacterium]
MKISFRKRAIALILGILSVFNLTPFTLGQVTDWLTGAGFSRVTAEEKAEMILDIYMNQDFIFLSSDSEDMARDFISQYLIQIFSGNGDAQVVVDALNDIPVYVDGNIQSEHAKEYQTDNESTMRTKKALLKLINGSGLPDKTKNSLGGFLNGVNDLNIYFLTTKYPGVYRFAGSYITDSGETVYTKSAIYYDKESGMIFNIDRKGILKIGFDCSVKNLSMTNPVDPWQRKFGFNILFDALGNILLTNIDTVRVKFDYNGQKKMAQFWKGNYTRISNGGEIGFYNRSEKNPLQYECFTDDELLDMSIEIYHGDELLYSRGPDEHWWITGYTPGPMINKKELTMVGTIGFDEQGMCDAFVAAAKKAFGSSAEITVDGMTAKIIWK